MKTENTSHPQYRGWAATIFLALLVAVPCVVVAARQAAATDKATLELRRLKEDVSKLKTQSDTRNPTLDSLAADVLALKLRETTSSAVGTTPSAAVTPDRVFHPEGEKETVQTKIAADRAKNVEAANRLGNQLDAELVGEAVDRQWSSQITDAVVATFESISGNRLIGTDCRSHMCRLIVDSDSPEDQRVLAQKILSGPPFDQEVLFRYDFESQPPRTTLYVARPGNSLKKLSEPIAQ